MKDKEFLLWLKHRMVQVHGENSNYDYMHRLQAIINATPEFRHTPAFNVWGTETGRMPTQDYSKLEERVLAIQAKEQDND